MLGGIDKFGEQITGKHRFHEPHWPSSGQLAETQSGRQALNSEPTPQRDSSQMLSLGFGLQAEPHAIIRQREHG